MKAILLTTVVWTSMVPACFAQVRVETSGFYGARQNTVDLSKQGHEPEKELEACLQTGRVLFGVDQRWAIGGQSDFAGPLGKQPTDFRIGNWGCTIAQFKVIRTVSGMECLVLPQHQNAEAVLIRGMDMSKVTNGAEFILQHPVVIQETYNYTVVSGNQKTALVLEVNERKLAEATATVRALAETERASVEAERLASLAKAKADEAARERIRKAKQRTWTSRNYQIEAEFISVNEGRVRLRRIDNDHEITVPMELLSAEDKKFIREQK